jgi:hypothetical protein
MDLASCLQAALETGAQDHNLGVQALREPDGLVTVPGIPNNPAITPTFKDGPQSLPYHRVAIG